MSKIHTVYSECTQRVANITFVPKAFGRAILTKPVARIFCRYIPNYIYSLHWSSIHWQWLFFSKEWQDHILMAICQKYVQSDLSVPEIVICISHKGIWQVPLLLIVAVYYYIRVVASPS